MKKNISYKLRLGLTAIPLFGLFIAILMGMYDFKKKGLLFMVLFCLLALVPFVIYSAICATIINLVILPIGVMWVKILLIVLISFFLCYGVAYTIVAIEYLLMKRIDNKEDKLDIEN